MKTKTIRMLVVFFAGILVYSLSFAQSVDFLIVSKSHAYTQTDNSSVVDATNPWRFDAHIEGSGLSGETVSFTKPSGSGSTTMTYDSNYDAWSTQASYATSGLLDAAYGNGNYSLTALGQTVTPVDLSGDSYPVAPIASLSGGTIVSGILTWNVAQALTITISGTSIDHMGINVNGNSYNGSNEDFGVTTLSFTIAAASLTAGSNYTVSLDFDDVVGGTNVFNFGGTGGMASAKYAGVYNSNTSFTIQAIPEPSTYAGIFGVVAMGGVMVRRRRTLAT